MEREYARRAGTPARTSRISRERTPAFGADRSARGTASRLLSLQRTFGNRAVSASLQQQIPASPAAPLLQLKRAPAESGHPAAHPRTAGGAERLPDSLRSGVETLSGLWLGDVDVHYNSSLPATLRALAYTRGRSIHLAPGQDRHLAHEAWHVVQQAQGRVAPTTQTQSGVLVNDDKKLEREADVMGERALAVGGTNAAAIPDRGTGLAELRGEVPVQRYADQNNPTHLFTANAVVNHTVDLVLRADRLNKPTAGDLGKHAANAGKEVKPKSGKGGSTWKAGTNTGQSLISNMDSVPEGKRDKVKIVKSIPASLEIRQTAGLHHAELVTTSDMSASQIGAAVSEVVLTDKYDEAVSQLAAE